MQPMWYGRKCNMFKCNSALVNDIIIKEDRTEIQVSKCPNEHGKIKSPMCCGQDMNYSI